MRRVEHLEDTGDGGECPRCSGVVGIFMNGRFSSAHKNGEPMSEEEWDAFEAEEEEGRCPVCGQKTKSVTIGWPESAA